MLKRDGKTVGAAPDGAASELRLFLLMLSFFSPIESALEDFKNGQFLIVTDDESRENEGDVIIGTDADGQNDLTSRIPCHNDQ